MAGEKSENPNTSADLKSNFRMKRSEYARNQSEELSNNKTVIRKSYLSYLKSLSDLNQIIQRYSFENLQSKYVQRVTILNVKSLKDKYVNTILHFSKV